MFDALMTVVAADRDRACMVASFLPEDKAWGRRQKVCVETDDEPMPLVFDLNNPLSVAEMAARLQSLTPVEEKPGDDLDAGDGDIL